MKRLTNILTIGFVVCFALIASYLLLPVTTAANGAFTGLPLNQPRVVNFSVRKEAWDKKSSREKLDQMRDWLLYTVVSESGRPTKEMGDILYDLPVVRQGYMHQVGAFEYGDTRSRLIGDGEIVALLPANGAGNRSDQLAHIADEHRKNTGQIPTTLVVFDYQLTLDDAGDNPSGELTRREAIDARELFTEKYGYVESRIRTIEDLKGFMSQIDDLVFAQSDGAELKLGGRKIKGYQYHGVSLEHIATIWQSENKIQTRRAEFDKQWEQKITELDNRWSNRTYVTDAEKRQLEADRDKEWEQLKSAREEAARREHLVPGSGFSLDPAYHYDELKRHFNTVLVPLSQLNAAETFSFQLSPHDLFKQSFRKPSSSGPGVSQVNAALDKCDMEPFFDWLTNLKESDPELAKLVEESFKVGRDPERSQVPKSLVPEAFYVDQEARYDGDLQGTEVGMILFYTDLLAKLWVFDYDESTPREIPDFHSGVEIGKRLSKVYRQQFFDMPYGRLWFGPDTDGYQVVDSGQQLAFGRRATRIFAKSTGSVFGRDEVEADPAMAWFIGWWDDHYEEIARYEPQYEKLNQIMKWSLLITWLNQANKGELLSFLSDQNYPIKNPNYRFPEWAKQHQSELKFNKWNAGMFLPASSKCTGTETLPPLSSKVFSRQGDRPGENEWTLSGGVSLSRAETFAERALVSAETKVSSLARRPGLDYAPLKSAENALQTVEGTAYKFQSLARDEVLITSTPKSGAMLRTPFGDLAPGNFEHVLKSKGLGLRIEARYGQTAIGDLTIDRGPNAFRVGWESLELDSGQTLAQQLSKTADPARVLANDPMVESAVKLADDGGYLIKTRNSERWMRLMPEEKASSAIPEGWQARFADTDPGAQPLQAAWWDQVKVRDELTGTSIRISRNGSTGPTIEVVKDVPVSAGEHIKIVSGETSIEATRDSQTGSVFVRYGDLPEPLQKNPGALQKAVARVEPLTSDKVLRVGELRRPGDDAVAEMLASKRYDAAAKNLANDPLDFKLALDRQLSEALKQSDELLARGDYGLLQNQLGELIELYGPRPDLVIRRGVAQINEGRLASAVSGFDDAIMEGQVVDRTAFINEVNLRLKTSAPSSQVVRMTDDGKQIALHCEIERLPMGTKVRPEAFNSDSALLYVQDNPGLNNLDWNTDLQATLKQVISGDLGEIIRLPRGDLTKFRPTQIYVADAAETFRVARTTTPTTTLLPIVLGTSLKCSSDDKNSEGCNDVYLVVAYRK